MIIDYLFQTGNWNGMQNAIGKYNPDGRGPLYDPTNGWRADVSNICTVTDYTDPANPKPVNGVFVWVSLPKLDQTLQSSPACELVADREKALSGDPNYLIYSTLTSAQRAVQQISPVFAGAHYPFQAR